LVAVDLPEIALEVTRLLQPQAAKRGIVMQVEAPAEVSKALGDANQIRQVLLNLLLNAVQAHAAAAQSDGAWIKISFHSDGKETGFTIEDNGEGIAPEDLEKLFEPFFTTKEDRAGTGLGLAVTHAIVTAHGGRLTARSDGPGRGAQFRVSLPTAPVPASANVVSDMKERA
jgi:two-component system NtrC family sensor kinase